MNLHDGTGTPLKPEEEQSILKRIDLLLLTMERRTGLKKTPKYTGKKKVPKHSKGARDG